MGEGTWRAETFQSAGSPHEGPSLTAERQQGAGILFSFLTFRASSLLVQPRGSHFASLFET